MTAVVATSLARSFLHLHPSLRTEKESSLVLLSKISGGSIAVSTQKKYSAAWHAYVAWFPTDLQSKVFDSSVNSDFTTALFLADLFHSSQDASIGPGKFMTTHAAIAHYFHQANLKSPTEGPLCKLMYHAAERHLRGSKLSRDPLTAIDLKQILDQHLTTTCSLRVRMHLTVIVLMFLGCLRFDDACAILVHEDLLQFIPISSTNSATDGMLIFIPRSKTDQAWSGKWIAIGATNGRYCPVRLIKELLAQGHYITSHISHDCGPLLRAVRWIPSSQSHVLQKILYPWTALFLPSLTHLLGTVLRCWCLQLELKSR